MKKRNTAIILTMLSLIDAVINTNALENTISTEYNNQNINTRNKRNTKNNEETTNTPKIILNSKDTQNSLNENDSNNIKALPENSEEINSIIETARNEINNALSQMDDLELNEILKKEKKNNNRK